MKNLIYPFLVYSLLLFNSCNHGSPKQTLFISNDNASDSITIDNNKMDGFIENSSSKSIVAEKNTSIATALDNDTTIYEAPATTAILENAIDYFRANNKYKNWDKENKKTLLVKCIAEKDGSTSNVRLLRGGSGIIDLDNEAIRLIEQSKLTPARNEDNEIVRSSWVIAIHFPTE